MAEAATATAFGPGINFLRLLFTKSVVFGHPFFKVDDSVVDCDFANPFGLFGLLFDPIYYQGSIRCAGFYSVGRLSWTTTPASSFYLTSSSSSLK